MNITTLLDTFVDAVAASAAIDTWCRANYSKSQTVYKGTDIRNPPTESEYPVTHFFKITKTVGYELDQADHAIGVVCGIYDATQTTTEVAVGENTVNLVEMAGIDNIEAYRKLVETACAAVIPGGHFLDVVEIEYDDIEFFPYFLASMELSIGYPYSQGGDPLA